MGDSSLSNDQEPSDETLVRLYTPTEQPPTFPASLYPAPDPPLPPAIFHISITPKQPVSISQLIQSTTHLLLTLIHDLIPFGSVHLQRLSSSDGRSSPSKPVRTSSDITLPPDHRVYLRVHASPRRFTPFYPVRIIRHNPPHFLIVSKPPNLPTHPTTDNLKENALAQGRDLLTNANQQPEMLHAISRLDVPTSGLILLTTSRKATSYFHNNPPTKTYIALTNTAVLPGYIHNHYHKNHPLLRPRIPPPSNPLTPPILLPFLHPPTHPYIPASLLILSCTPFHDTKLYEVKVRLITGRTHQIRLQLAGVGASVVGDEKYGKGGEKVVGGWGVVLGRERGGVGLHAVEIEGVWEGGGFAVRDGEMWWRREGIGGEMDVSER